MKNALIATVAAAAIASSGCATLFAKKTADVTTNTGTTASDLSKKEDHNVGGCQIESGINWAWFVLDLFLTGPIGIIIDGVTGNWKSLDSDCASIDQ